MNNAELEKKIKQLVHSLAYQKGFVCSVDVLLALGYLSKQDYEAWRFGKVDYLERVCKLNLNKLSLINRTMRRFAVELKLEASITGYSKFGKGTRAKLVFSKSGDPKIEVAYATHYVDKDRIIEMRANKSGEEQ